MRFRTGFGNRLLSTQSFCFGAGAEVRRWSAYHLGRHPGSCLGSGLGRQQLCRRQVAFGSNWFRSNGLPRGRCRRRRQRACVATRTSSWPAQSKADIWRVILIAVIIIFEFLSLRSTSASSLTTRTWRSSSTAGTPWTRWTSTCSLCSSRARCYDLWLHVRSATRRELSIILSESQSQYLKCITHPSELTRWCSLPLNSFPGRHGTLSSCCCDGTMSWRCWEIRSEGLSSSKLSSTSSFVTTSRTICQNSIRIKNMIF